jgi:ABC-type phosphate transport system permease subunit
MLQWNSIYPDSYKKLSAITLNVYDEISFLSDETNELADAVALIIIAFILMTQRLNSHNFI